MGGGTIFQPKDSFAVGILAGIIANFIINISIYILFFLQITEYTFWHIAASLYFLPEDVHTIPGYITGTITDYSLAAFLGIVTVYLLQKTGRDYHYLKGLFLGLLAYVFIFGFILALDVARINPTDAGTNLVKLLCHAALGLLLVFFVKKFGSKVLD